MRFLADENFPGSAVRSLSAANHDVVWVRTERPGSSDRDVLDWAAREKRIAMPSASDAGEKIAARVTERSDWGGHFSVVEPARVRMRPLAGT